MAKKRPARRAASPATAVTFERAARLFRLLTYLGAGPQKREALVRRLGLGVRGFYRDLDALRRAGIEADLEEGRYVLRGDVAEATARLPFPDPGLTLGEARQLARGRMAAHRKLAGQVAAVAGSERRRGRPKA
jgi:predicted DNA-binding transcriptional regulator YafY